MDAVRTQLHRYLKFRHFGLVDLLSFLLAATTWTIAPAKARRQRSQTHTHPPKCIAKPLPTHRNVVKAMQSSYSSHAASPLLRSRVSKNSMSQGRFQPLGPQRQPSKAYSTPHLITVRSCLGRPDRAVLPEIRSC